MQRLAAERATARVSIERVTTERVPTERVTSARVKGWPEEGPALRFDDRGLLPVVVQEVSDGAVLMLAYADREALERTLATGDGHYFSRSRQRLWRKGETSGNVQRVHEVLYDCDADTLLYRVSQSGPACHTGERSCFHRSLAVAGVSPRDAGAPHDADDDRPSLGEALSLLEAVVAERLATLPEGSYVRRLHEGGLGYVSQKVVEEAGETIVAALEGRRGELRGEAADLLFHLTVLLAETGVDMSDVAQTIVARHRDTHS